MTDTAHWSVTGPGPGDFAAWRELYRGFTAFHRVPATDGQAAVVWSWLTDPAHELECLLVRATDGTPVALAHFRPFVRTLYGNVAGFLDDLFVSPRARGAGAVDLLLARLREIAAERGWSTVRWITAEDNHRARAVYDRVATRTAFVTYDMAPAAPGADRAGRQPGPTGSGQFRPAGDRAGAPAVTGRGVAAGPAG